MSNKKYLLVNGSSKEILNSFPPEIFHSVITSPPYFNLRDYSVEGQLGQEKSPEEYVENLVEICRGVKRVLRKDGTFWLNIGDSYNSDSGFCRATNGWDREGREQGSSDKKAIKHSYIKRKELFGVPWLVAFALQREGWFLRCDIIWKKENVCPDGAKDRPTRSHEYVFLLSKSPKYFYDYYNSLEATAYSPKNIQRFGARHQVGTFRNDQNRTFQAYGMRNRRSVWETSVSSFSGNHWATFALELIEPCIKVSTSDHGCCAQCGTPWSRKTEVIQIKPYNEEECEKKIVPLAWKKSCNCDTNEIKPCLILDPFSGMATTGIGCLKYNRNYVGIDINSEYINLSRERIYKEMGDDMFMEEISNLGDF